MFTQSVPAPTPAPSSSGLHVASPSSPASPTRTSRLRGLSYLRSYTQSHLLNRDQHAAGPSSPSSPGGSSGPHGGATAASAALSAVATTNGADSQQPAASAHQTLGSHKPHPSPFSSDTFAPLQPSQSAPLHGPSAAVGTSSSSSSAHGFGLVPTLAHPLGTSPPDSSAPTTSAFPVLQTAHEPPVHDPQEQPSNAAVEAVRSFLEQPPPADNSSSTNSFAPPATTMTRSRSATDSGVTAAAGAIAAMENLPSIRFSTFYDPRSTRPSLKFAPMSRTLPTGKEVIRVGRYSERDSQPAPTPNVPSAAHVGFKSKVVSRRHCEFWFENNRWYIKDVKSSSGTFLNHIRLSQPGTESKPFPINDGDIVQLGIDFKGGEEMIFRCVKMRVELNRGWQNKLNAFNLNTHKRLRNMTKPAEGDGATQSSQDCSICLNSIAPCQSLFVAPCSHTWHYKCIRSLLESPQYPSFICPNCRAAVDLEADVEDPPEEWEKMDSEEAFDGVPEEHIQEGAAAERTNGVAAAAASSSAAAAATGQPEAVAPAPAAPAPAGTHEVADTTMADDAMQIDTPPPEAQTLLPSQANNIQQQQAQIQAEHEDDNDQTVLSHATSSPVPIPNGIVNRQLANAAGAGATAGTNGTASTNGATGGANGSGSGAGASDRTPSPSGIVVAGHGHEGPITPRNNAGPWVFDGSGIRIGNGRASTESRRGEMRSLDTAAAEMAGQFSA